MPACEAGVNRYLDTAPLPRFCCFPKEVRRKSAVERPLAMEQGSGGVEKCPALEWQWPADFIPPWTQSSIITVSHPVDGTLCKMFQKSALKD